MRLIKSLAKNSTFFLFVLLAVKILLTARLGLALRGRLWPSSFVGAATGGILAFATSVFGLPTDMAYVIIVGSLAALVRQ